MERPILFKTDLVRAILDGRKTQTRRPIKKVPKGKFAGVFELMTPKGKALYARFEDGNEVNWVAFPYGNSGDYLWVRETFHKDENGVVYKADYREGSYPDLSWKPSLHLPRSDSRILLIIRYVLVERIQSITHIGAINEGASSREDFRNIWDSCYSGTEFSWECNPLVWTVGFRRV